MSSLDSNCDGKNDVQDNIQQIVATLRKRSTRALWIARSSIMFIVIVIVVVISVVGYATDQSIGDWVDAFSYGSESSIIDYSEKVKKSPPDDKNTREVISRLELRIAQVEKEKQQAISQREEIEAGNKRIEAEREVKRQEVTNRLEETKMRLTHLTATVTRFLTVALAFYLSQILTGFARYNFRLSHHLAMSANALLLAGTDTEKLAQWTEMLSGNIEFGKPPAMPFDKVLDAISDAIKREAKT